MSDSFWPGLFVVGRSGAVRWMSGGPRGVRTRERGGGEWKGEVRRGEEGGRRKRRRCRREVLAYTRYVRLGQKTNRVDLEEDGGDFVDSRLARRRRGGPTWVLKDPEAAASGPAVCSRRGRRHYHVNRIVSWRLTISSFICSLEFL